MGVEGKHREQILLFVLAGDLIEQSLSSPPTWMVKKVSYTGVVTDLVERPGTAVGALWTHRDAEITK